MVGEFPGLATLDEDDNLRHTTDFRAVYCSLLEQWLGVDAAGIIPERLDASRAPRWCDEALDGPRADRRAGAGLRARGRRRDAAGGEEAKHTCKAAKKTKHASASTAKRKHCKKRRRATKPRTPGAAAPGAPAPAAPAPTAPSTPTPAPADPAARRSPTTPSTTRARCR